MNPASARAVSRRGESVDPTARLKVDAARLAPLIPATKEGQLPTHRDLLLQALLHLPRIADVDGTVDVATAIKEIDRLRAQRAVELAPLRSLATPPPDRPSLDQLEVGMVSLAAISQIVEHFHYLGSLRSDSLNVAAMHKGRIAALCSFSPLDLTNVAAMLPVNDMAEAKVVSRVFAFDWAPENIISYMLARAERLGALRADCVRMMLTYMNPNMGFTGASFRAANWLPFGTETGTRYAYLDRRYVTDRMVTRLSATDRRRVEYSRMELRPLQVLCRLIDKRLQRDHPTGFDFVFRRQHS
jgi:hypothetical protein